MYGETAEIQKENGFIKNGETTTYYEVHYSVENKDNTPLVLLAGGPGLSFTTLNPLLKLAVDRPVIAYDQIGSGKSTRSDKLESLDLTIFIDQFEALIKKLDIQKYHLLGHSWGSILAIQSTLINPVKTKSLILHSGVADFQNCLEERRKLEKDNSMDDMKITSPLNNSNYCRVPFPKYLSDAIADKDTRTNELIWNHNLNSKMQYYDITQELDQIECPSLIISGKYDGISVGQSDKFSEGIRNSKHSLFQNSAHYAHVEEEEKFLKVVRSHLVTVDPTY